MAMKTRIMILVVMVETVETWKWFSDEFVKKLSCFFKILLSTEIRLFKSAPSHLFTD